MSCISLYLFVESLMTVGCSVGPTAHPPARDLLQSPRLSVNPQAFSWQAVVHVTCWDPTAAP